MSWLLDRSFSGWDRFGWTLARSWERNDGTLIDGYEHTYGRTGNPRFGRFYEPGQMQQIVGKRRFCR